MSNSSSEHEHILRDYLKEIEKYYKLGISKEHSYRSSLQTMLPRLVAGITAVNEPKRVVCGAPDYVVLRSAADTTLTVGYIEAKDIGISLDKVEKDEQMARYLRALDNLLLTDYVEFRWYVKSQKQMTARLATPQGGKSLVLNTSELETTSDLLSSFLKHNAEPIRSPEELARRMARLAHMIRDVTVMAFEQKEASDTLKGLYEAFKTVLLPELPTTQFADMFAQTLAYGLFAARYNHKSNEFFNRRDAAKEIPRTNPFLRKLFNMIAGPDFDDEPFIGFVNELTQVLGVTDMDAVLADFGKRTRREDPIVHFYETFLAQYDPKLRELRGVYYTPEPVVSYMVRSVDHLLREQFDCPDGLADTSTVMASYVDDNGKKYTERSPRVVILDPACGTGTFSYAIVDQIRETYRKMGNAGMWSGYVREHLLPRLFGFELLMAPYAVAHLKLGMQLAALDLPVEERSTWAYDFKTDERLGVYLTNTLEQVLGRSRLLLGSFISDEANEAARVKQDSPVMVVIGNPPYSYESANTGKWISNLVRDYYQVDNRPLGERNPKGLQDDYVKFVRFAQWRIEQTGYGILAFICNHGYLDNPTFRGLRQSLMKTFNEIYVLDLHGNSKKKERCPDGSKDENVFDIQQGVAIGIFVKHQQVKKQEVIIHHSHLWGLREVYHKTLQGQQLIGGKYHWLAENDLTATEWKTLTPQSPFYLFIPQSDSLRDEYNKLWKLMDLVLLNSVGIATSRDDLTIDYTSERLISKVRRFASLSTEEARQEFSLGNDTRDWQVHLAQADVNQQPISETLIKKVLYRPFDFRYTYYTGKTRGFISMPRYELIRHMLQPNIAAYVGRQGQAVGSDEWDLIFCGKLMEDYNLYRRGNNACFPLYLYPNIKNGKLFDTEEIPDAIGGRRPNLSLAFITDISNKLNMMFIPDGKGDLQQTFGPEDIFSYMYAVFHSPTYRTRYAEFLKIDFPRLPLTSNAELFRELCRLGERLVGLHLMEKFGKVTVRFSEKGNDVVEKVEYWESREQPGEGRVYINKSQYFEGVPLEVWNFHVGGYQVCHKWLKDRKGRVLSFEDIVHYQRVVAALGETIELMEKVDEVIEEGGGWPMR